jgi:CheY-like chemotaxis protein
MNKPAEKLLIIEDSGIVREMLRATLSYGAYEIHEAENGPSGLKKASELDPDVVVLDVMMPGGMNGYEVCSQLKRPASGKVPFVVLVTAMGSPTDFARGVAAGTDAHIVKPFSPERLIEVIESRGVRQLRGKGVAAEAAKATVGGS